MYILELIKVNKKEDLFFEDSEQFKNFAQEHVEFLKEFNDLHQDFFFKKEKVVTYKKERLVDGSYKSSQFIKYFKRKQDVSTYMYNWFEHTQPINWTEDGVKYYTKPTSEMHEKTIGYHRDRQTWVMEHEIYNEMNVLDVSGNYIACLTGCSQNICIKYGGCTPGFSCESQQPDNPIYKKEGISYHHIPVMQIKRATVNLR